MSQWAEEDFDRLTVAELRRVLRDNDLSTRGTRRDLLARVGELVQSAQPEPSDADSTTSDHSGIDDTAPAEPAPTRTVRIDNGSPPAPSPVPETGASGSLASLPPWRHSRPSRHSRSQLLRQSRRRLQQQPLPPFLLHCALYSVPPFLYAHQPFPTLCPRTSSTRPWNRISVSI